MTEETLLKKLKRKVRYGLRFARYTGSYRRLSALKGRYAGQRCFLVASGPSISEMDLSPLNNEFVCMVNASVKGIGAVVPKADMHVVLDNNRYRRFAEIFEDIAQENAVKFRFYNFAVRRHWRRLPRRYAEPYFVMNHPVTLEERGVPLGFMRGGVAAGSTVLLGAAQICSWMGFSEIYILGCDLSYDDAPTPYFYAMSELDNKHEEDSKVQARRMNMHLVNREFSALAEELEKHGTRLFNAGKGGNLTSLPRVAFPTLFSGD